MDKEDRIIIENDLIKYQKRLINQVDVREEYKSLIEELTSQRESNPYDESLKEELLHAYIVQAKKEADIEKLIETIKTLEWLLI
ncbi:MAG: hypothetical protein ACKVOU_03080 [Cytophagales bacterium]